MMTPTVGCSMSAQISNTADLETEPQTKEKVKAFEFHYQIFKK